MGNVLLGRRNYLKRLNRHQRVTLFLAYSTTPIQHFIESRRVLIEMDSYFHELPFLFVYFQNWPFISGVRDDWKKVIGRDDMITVGIRD